MLVALGCNPFLAIDNLQRPIVAPDMDQLRNSGRVTIKVDDKGNKVYTIEEKGGV